jgi:hypothetical protein
MGSQAGGDGGAQVGSQRPVVLEGGQRPDPVDGSDRDFHRVGPVDSYSRGIGGDPGAQLRLELDRRRLVVEDSGRPAKGEEVMAAAQPPRDLGVAVVVGPRRYHVLVKDLRPAQPALEVRVPVDLHSELDRARAEEVDGVGEGCVPLVTELVQRPG